MQRPLGHGTYIISSHKPCCGSLGCHDGSSSTQSATDLWPQQDRHVWKSYTLSTYKCYNSNIFSTFFITSTLNYFLEKVSTRGIFPNQTNSRRYTTDSSGLWWPGCEFNLSITQTFCVVFPILYVQKWPTACILICLDSHGMSPYLLRAYIRIGGHTSH